MVVKTEVCTFSELKIYPGKGIRYMSKDCKLPIFLSKKSTVLYLKKVRPQKIRWCTAWRRINKKLQTGEVNNKRKRRAKKIVR
jgi:large subunit ribosomal protein L24e